MSTETKYRVVLAGCGGISRAWLEYAAAAPDLEFVGLVDLYPAVASERKEQFGLEQAVRWLGMAVGEEVAFPDVVDPAEGERLDEHRDDDHHVHDAHVDAGP